MPVIDPTTVRDIRSALLTRSGLLAPASNPELDRWTAVLRRATGAVVAALAVPLGERTLVSGLWVGDAAEPEATELPAGQSLEQFLSAKIATPAWADGRHSYFEDSVVVDGEVLCTVAVADAAPRDWDARDRQVMDDTTAAIASEIRLRLANDEALRFHELVASLAGDSRDQAIVSSLISLARALGCAVTAEGVEPKISSSPCGCSSASGSRASCSHTRCRRRSWRRCSATDRLRLLGRQQPPMARLTSVG